MYTLATSHTAPVSVNRKVGASGERTRVDAQGAGVATVRPVLIHLPLLWTPVLGLVLGAMCSGELHLHWMLEGPAVRRRTEALCWKDIPGGKGKC